MSEFKYRTRIGDSPRGRQKLYFCCHPDDLVDRKERVKYLEVVTIGIK